MSKNTIVTIIILAVLFVGAGLIFGGNFRNKNSDSEKSEEISNDDLGGGTQNTRALPDEYKNKKAVLVTNHGGITIEFFDNDAPLAVENFIRLSKDGKYNNTSFHRVIKNFMIQGGDYENGDGTGGQSVFGQEFADELYSGTESFKAGYKRGVVAMANRGPNTNGSQFFIMHADNPLPPLYTIFAYVVDGMDTVDKIASVPVLANDTGSISSPLEKVILESITIEERN